MRPIEQQFFNDLEKKLWTAADKLRSNLDAAVYKHVVLGLIFLKYVSDAFEERQRELRKQFTNPDHEYYMAPEEYGGAGTQEYEDNIAAELEVRDYYTEKNVFWVPLEARWQILRDCAQLPPKAALPWNKPGKGQPLNLKSKDILGHVYEYFLGQFALAEGKKGGQYYTPKSIVTLIVEMLQPFKGRVYDPAMGSGGFFVQSEEFIEQHSGKPANGQGKKASGQISVYGQESNPTTWRLAAMNMAIRGIDFNFGSGPADTRVLRQHLVDGYTLNEQRLQERGIEFEQAINLLSRTLANQQLVADEGRAVLQVIGDYARSWSLLQGYDEQNLAEQSARQNGMRALALDDALAAMAQLKAQLIAKGEATELFGQLRGDGLASAIATIEQGFGDELFYPNVASRAAHLLYFVIKNHPLADGNKRTGSFLFLWYLRLNQHLLARPVEQLINDNTLVALALLVAESLNPDEIAFYDALANNESAVRELGDDILKKIAVEITEKLRNSTTVDWQVRESVRAKLRILVRRTLKKWKYPPVGEDAAIELVLKQAESLSNAWSK